MATARETFCVRLVCKKAVVERHDPHLTGAATARPPASSSYLFKNTERSNHVTAALVSFQQASLYTDVELKARDGVVTAHKLILTTASSYFSRLFSRNWNTSDTISFENVGKHALQKIISYLYTGELEINNADLDDLTTLADMFHLRELIEECSKVSQPRLIVLGGQVYKQQGQIQKATVTDCSVLKGNTWQTVAKLPLPQWTNFASCELGCQIVVSGGMELNEKTGGTSGRVIPDCWRLTTINMKWEKLPDLIHKRCHHGCVAVAGSVYVVGGKCSGQPIGPVERLVAGGTQWQTRAAMPTPVYDAGTAGHKDNIITFGGKNRAGKATQMTQVYNNKTNVWKTAAPLPKSSMVMGAVSHKNTILVFDYLSTPYKCYSYNPDRDQFTTLTSSPGCHHYAPPVVLGGKVLLMSGLTETDKTTPAVEEYDPTRGTWAASRVPLLREMTNYAIHCVQV